MGKSRYPSMKKVMKYHQVQLNEICKKIKDEKQINENMKAEILEQRSHIEKVDQENNEYNERIQDTSARFGKVVDDI